MKVQHIDFLHAPDSHAAVRPSGHSQIRQEHEAEGESRPLDEDQNL
jgi:hypothetical protein